jgi:hypothetical protein
MTILNMYSARGIGAAVLVVGSAAGLVAGSRAAGVVW